MKKFIRMFSAALLVLAALYTLSGCSVSAQSLTETITQAVQLPDSYRIQYEITAPDGVVTTAVLSRDAEGSVYTKLGEAEKLFLCQDGAYTLYLSVDGELVRTDAQLYTNDYVESACADLMTYVEKSLKTFLPGAEAVGTAEMAGRACTEYGISVGFENTGIRYTVLVDDLTGVCLSWQQRSAALG